jgi:hypothetical protein
MGVASTDRSGPRWFSSRGRVVLVFVALLIGTLLAVWAIRSVGSQPVRPDLGPGPVRGVRLAGPGSGEGMETCRGIPAAAPTVRLVEQVDVETMTVCLGPGRRGNTYPLEPYVLAASDPDGERLLDAWAAAWSRPDRQPAWGEESVTCTDVGSSYPALGVTVDGVSVRPVPPLDGCIPLPAALAVLDEITRAARPAP